jgi:flagellar biosynthesis/type III secretory pathway chaperone
LSTEERRILISGEAENLEDIVRREFRELTKLGAIEKKRLELHSVISAEFAIPIQDINLSAIADRATQEEREAIITLQTDLTDLIAEHTALNNENRELINAHLEYSEIMIDLMVDSEDPLNNFYDGDGNAAQEKKKTTGFFDSRA